MPVFARPLPPALAVLHELALDLHWSWNHAGDQLWRRINAEVWERTQNPVSVLHLIGDEQLADLAGDAVFISDLRQLVEARQDYVSETSWFQHHYADQNLGTIAYFSMEFGLCDALPLYAGGLGILAGDYLKTASDLGVPVVGIGLLYQQGYFRQSLSSDGWQQETYLFNDPGSLPLQALRAEDGTWLYIETEFLCRRVRFRVWKAQVGRVTLYLLDSNDPRNQISDRGITSKLYGGTPELRLVQEIALGICGWRLLERLGLTIDVCHLNEGHAAFATLERARAFSERHKVDFWKALWATRSSNVFTTHTPVVAGFDRYPLALLKRYIGQYAGQLGLTMDELVALGQAKSLNPNSEQVADSRQDFNMAYLAMNTCATSNGVSRLHGEVSRKIFQPLFPRWPQRDVPVGHVTNGVHIPTWDSADADAEWTRLYGKNRWRGDLLPDAPAVELDDNRLWQMIERGRNRLVSTSRQRLANQRRHESEPLSCALDTRMRLSPQILTLGFARRFAEYKRPDLLLHDPERLARLLNHSRYPVQLIIAGKAHPADDTGKKALQRWHQFVQREDVSARVVLIEDYDMTLAQELVQGVDVWLNTPRRPWEASGTSGMKVLVNGGLNLSSLDGWWAEAYHPDLGWALGDGAERGPEGDEAEAQQLYQLLEDEVAPLFYTRDHQGLPREWLRRVKTSMIQLTARFSSNRMMEDYLNLYYLPAAASGRARRAKDGALAKELWDWHRELETHWHDIHISGLVIRELTIGELSVDKLSTGKLSTDKLSIAKLSAPEQKSASYMMKSEHGSESEREVTVKVHLGSIKPESVAVQIIADAEGEHPSLTLPLTQLHAIDEGTNSYCYGGNLPGTRPAHHFSVRVISAHADARIPAENALIRWQE